MKQNIRKKILLSALLMGIMLLQWDEEQQSVMEKIVKIIWSTNCPYMSFIEEQIEKEPLIESSNMEDILLLEEEERTNVIEEMALENEAITQQEEPEEKEMMKEVENQENTTNPLFQILKITEPVQTISKAIFNNPTELQKKYYTVDATTEISASKLSFDNLYGRNMKIEKGEKPQILIYHTHSQEGFVDSVPGDASTTVVGAGTFLTEILQEEYGYQVIHDCGTYDIESRDYAYSNAEPAIEKILQDNPSIEVVIDLHRDAVPEDRKLVTEIQGIQVAKFMFFNGLSHTKKLGDITYLENPHIDENLAFAFQMETTAESYYPGITRKIYLKGYRYNMHFRGKSLLVEMGAQTNTVQEIMNACIPLAHVLNEVLSGNTVIE